MANKAVEEQAKVTIEIAKGSKGSQRIFTAAMCDKDSYVEFYVPEWVAALSSKDGADFAKKGWLLATAKPWVPKAPTKKAESEDENLTTTATGATGTRNRRKPLKGGSKRPGSGTILIGTKVTIFPAPNVTMKRGTKSYKQRSFRVPSVLDARCISYFVQEAIGKERASHFAVGGTMYPVGEPKIEIGELGSLRDNDGAVTAP